MGGTRAKGSIVTSTPEPMGFTVRFTFKLKAAAARLRIHSRPKWSSLSL